MNHLPKISASTQKSWNDTKNDFINADTNKVFCALMAKAAYSACVIEGAVINTHQKYPDYKVEKIIKCGEI